MLKQLSEKSRRGYRLSNFVRAFAIEANAIMSTSCKMIPQWVFSILRRQVGATLSGQTGLQLCAPLIVVTTRSAVLLMTPQSIARSRFFEAACLLASELSKSRKQRELHVGHIA